MGAIDAGRDDEKLQPRQALDEHAHDKKDVESLKPLHELQQTADMVPERRDIDSIGEALPVCK